MSQDVIYLSMDQKVHRRVSVVRMAVQMGTLTASIKTGVSCRTIRSWKKRFNDKGIDGLKDQCKAPKRVWNKKDLDKTLEKAVSDLAANEPGLHLYQVLGKLMCEDSDSIPSIAWLKRARKRLGLTRRRRSQINQHTTRYEVPIPGALQIDTKEVKHAEDSREKLYQFTAIDECTRVRFLGGSFTKGAEAARKFLVNALDFYEALGVYVWRVQTDHGTEFTLPENDYVAASFARGNTPKHIFTKECESRGIRHRLIKVATPELNGKVERSHRIDEERFYSRFEFTNELALDHALKNVWMPEYNEHRTHGALGYKTPMEFLKEKLDYLKNNNIQDVRPQYETKKAA